MSTETERSSFAVKAGLAQVRALIFVARDACVRARRAHTRARARGGADDVPLR
jgi:hypothetical protein